MGGGWNGTEGPAIPPTIGPIGWWLGLKADASIGNTDGVMAMKGSRPSGGGHSNAPLRFERGIRSSAAPATAASRSQPL